MAHEEAIKAAAVALLRRRGFEFLLGRTDGGGEADRVKWIEAMEDARAVVVAFLRECECSEGIAKAFWKSPGVKSNPDERPGITWSAMRDALIRDQSPKPRSARSTRRWRSTMVDADREAAREWCARKWDNDASWTDVRDAFLAGVAHGREQAAKVFEAFDGVATRAEIAAAIRKRGET